MRHAVLRLVLRVLTFAAVLLGAIRTAEAHKPSDSYLNLKSAEARILITWHIAVRDLDDALNLDEDRNGSVLGRELRANDAKIREYARAHLRLGREQLCTLDEGTYRGVVDHSDGTYVSLDFEAVCTEGLSPVRITYTLFREIDPTHRGIMRFNGGEPQIASVSSPVVQFAPEASGYRRVLRMSRDGIAHIWTGYDHLLFLLALLLPAVLTRDLERRTWHIRARLKDVLGDVAKVVTSFTLAHSVTLSLAALGFVSLPSRLVESVIALSVVLAALNNIVPFLREDRWLAAFVLGLMHGFGFSSTLTDLGLSRDALFVPLVGFNLGVEVGQMGFVLVVVPLLFWARTRARYVRFVLQGGSLAIAFVALLWLVERALEIKIFS
jgi:hypothetical protein